MIKQYDFVSFAVDCFLESFTECASMSDDKDRHHTWSGLRDWRRLGGSTVGRRRATIDTSFPRCEKRFFSIHLPSLSSSGPPLFDHSCQTPNPVPVTRQEIDSKEWDLAWGLKDLTWVSIVLEKMCSPLRMSRRHSEKEFTRLWISMWISTKTHKKHKTKHTKTLPPPPSLSVQNLSHPWRLRDPVREVLPEGGKNTGRWGTAIQIEPFFSIISVMWNFLQLCMDIKILFFNGNGILQFCDDPRPLYVRWRILYTFPISFLIFDEDVKFFLTWINTIFSIDA